MVEERKHIALAEQSRFRDWPSMTSRGGGDPNNSMASMPSAEWARRLGASPSKRMTASWSGSNTDPTEYKVAARCLAPNGGLPSGRSHRKLDIQIPIQGVVRDAQVGAVLAAFDMTAQRRCSERSIADMTLSWPRLTWPAWDARQAGPRWRKMSATSTAGRDNGRASAGHLPQEVERAGHLADRVDRYAGVERRRVEFLMSQ